MPDRPLSASPLSQLLTAEIDARAGETDPLVLYAILRDRSGYSLQQIPLPPAAASVQAVIHAAAARTAAVSGYVPRDTRYFGAAARLHSWTLPWDKLAGEERWQAVLDSRAGRIDKRPDRIPAQYMIAATRNGELCEAIHLVTEPRARPLRLPGGYPFAGAEVGLAMQSLAAELTGIPQPQPPWVAVPFPAEPKDSAPGLE